MTVIEKIEFVIIIVAVVVFALWFITNALKNKWISGISETVNKAIKEAENSKKTGEEKKAYVLEKVKEKCVELKIPYKLLFGLVSKLIDTIVKHYNVISK